LVNLRDIYISVFLDVFAASRKEKSRVVKVGRRSGKGGDA